MQAPAAGLEVETRRGGLLPWVAAGGALSGTIEPYRDPDCDCTLATTFAGEVDGDRIEGTYTWHGGAAHRSTSGRWEVRRVVGATAP